MNFYFHQVFFRCRHDNFKQPLFGRGIRLILILDKKKKAL